MSATKILLKTPAPKPGVSIPVDGTAPVQAQLCDVLNAAAAPLRADAIKPIVAAVPAPSATKGGHRIDTSAKQVDNAAKQVDKKKKWQTGDRQQGAQAGCSGN